MNATGIFGPTLTVEHLREEGFQVAKETLRDPAWLADRKRTLAGGQWAVRLLQILQHRPVKALRLSDVGDLAAANAFLPGDLAGHNARFAVIPEDEAYAHVPCAGEVTGLARSRTLHHCRKLSKDLVLSFNRQRYILQTGGQPRHALRGETVTVVTYPDHRVELLYGEDVLPFKVFDRPGQ